MKKVMINEKLEELGVYFEDINLGVFDGIGELTAKKNRNPNSELFRKVGSYFRPNYERGILMYYLARKKEFKSILEIGFGRGYATFCMAKAMCDHGIDGKITTVDPNFNEEFLNNLTKFFPKEWFEKIQFIQSTAEQFYSESKDRSFDFIYIDGDHRYEAVKKDWEYAKEHFNSFVLFDDYHLPSKQQKDIECARLINEIEGYNKDLIIMDRRIFFDDRRISDEDIDYGQVLISRLN